VLLQLIGTGLWRNGCSLFELGAAGVLAALTVGVLGMLLGYEAARAARLPVPSARAVSFETGIQSSPLAFGILVSRFPESAQEGLLQLPMAYALFVLGSASLATLLFRVLDARGVEVPAFERP
jgi:BASS family bile acid:Na+ symporter